MNRSFPCTVFSLGGCVLAVLSGGALAATTLTFQEGVDGYSGTVDTFLRGAAPDAPQGSSAAVEWDGDDGGGQNFALLRFDDIFGEGPGQIPPGSFVTSASLMYTVSNVGNDGTINEVSVAWDESVTFNTFGGDAGVQSDEYGASPGAAPGSVAAHTVDVTSSLVAWAASPSANNGWIVRPTGGTDGVQFRSREYATVAERPALSVTFIPVVDAVVLLPEQINTVVGRADQEVLVAIPPTANQSVAVEVTLTTNDTTVAVPVGASGNSLVVTFAAGGASQQIVSVDIGVAGNATITTGNDAELDNTVLAVDVSAGAVAFDPPMLVAAQGTSVAVRVSISPGSNDTRPVEVTLTTDDVAVAVPGGATGHSLLLTFAAGAVLEQTVAMTCGNPGMGTITTTNDGGLTDAALSVKVISGFMFTAVADTREFTAPTEFPVVLADITATGGPGAFLLAPGDMDPPQGIDAAIAAAFGSGFPWYLPVGNHEEETAADMEWVRNAFASLPYIVNSGPPGSVTTNYSYDYGNAHFVVLNEYADGTTCDDCLDGDVVPALYDWLEADLAATEKKWIFVSGHEPPYPQPDAYWGDLRHVGDSLDAHPANRDAFWALLDAYDVVAYVCGHTHRYSRYFQDDVWQVDCSQARGTGPYDTYVRIFVEKEEVTFHVYRSLDTGRYSLNDAWSVVREDPPNHPDFDKDGDVDLSDFGFFTVCFNGPNRPPTFGSVCLDGPDLDSDGDVDLTDFAVFSGCFNGPNRPPACE